MPARTHAPCCAPTPIESSGAPSSGAALSLDEGGEVVASLCAIHDAEDGMIPAREAVLT